MNIEAIQIAVKRFCQSEHISLTQFAASAGLSRATVQGIMNGKNQSPSIDTFWKIAQALGLHHDEYLAYLYSISDEMNPDTYQEDYYGTYPTGRLAAARLSKMRRDKGLAVIDVYRATGVAYDFEERTSKEDLSILIAMADFYHVSIDYIVGRTDEPFMPSSADVEQLSPEELGVLAKLRSAKDD